MWKRIPQGCTVVVATLGFFAVVMCIVLGMDVKNKVEVSSVIQNSLENQLVGIAAAARELIDPEEFVGYNNLRDVEANQAAYDETLISLRKLKNAVGAEYLYALKKINGVAYFVFDTDEVDEAVFLPYELDEIHEEAFAGRSVASIDDYTDAYGTFDSGAVPLWHDGVVVGVVVVDMMDTSLEATADASRRNAVILVVTLLAVMVVVFVVMLGLLRRNRQMQEQLQRMAHYDVVTGLPNRQYLMDYLDKLAASSAGKHFALFFIDLDNFKDVNDTAGHDAGDELLWKFARFLEANREGGETAYRPSPGKLNVSARVGGDEFIEILPGVETPEQAAKAAGALFEKFREQDFGRFVEKYGVSMSVGVALYPSHSADYNVLIKYADIAMYHAKRAGKGQYRVYDEGMQPKPEK